MTDMRYVTWLVTCRRCCWPLACSGISLQRGSREWSAHSSAMGFPHRYLVGKYGPSGPLALSSGSFRFGPDCSLIPGFDVKLSAIILAGPTVLSAVATCPPHDGVRRRWWINVASAVSPIESSQKIGRSHHRHRPGRDVFSRRGAEPCDLVMLVTRQPPSSTS